MSGANGKRLYYVVVRKDRGQILHMMNQQGKIMRFNNRIAASRMVKKQFNYTEFQMKLFGVAFVQLSETAIRSLEENHVKLVAERNTPHNEEGTALDTPSDNHGSVD